MNKYLSIKPSFEGEFMAGCGKVVRIEFLFFGKVEYVNKIPMFDVSLTETDTFKFRLVKKEF
jgi:hypothetical protein